MTKQQDNQINYTEKAIQDKLQKIQEDIRSIKEKQETIICCCTCCLSIPIVIFVIWSFIVVLGIFIQLLTLHYKESRNIK